MYGSRCHFDETARPKSNRAAVLKPQTDRIVLSRPYVYDYVETREPPDQHAAFNLRRARKGYAVDFDHRFPLTASTLALPHGGVTARVGTHAQGRSGAQPRQPVALRVGPYAW